MPGAGSGWTLHWSWWVANVFQSVDVIFGWSSVWSGSKFGLRYSKKTFGILEQRNNNGSYTILKEIDGKNHEASLCKWITIMFPDALRNFAPVSSKKLGMN